MTNVGPNPYFGPLSLKDTSIGAIANTLPSVAPICVGGPAVLATAAGNVLVNPGVPEQRAVLDRLRNGPAVCSANNTQTIVGPSPGSAQNPAGND